MSSRTNSLPSEIVDRILDFVVEEQPSSIRVVDRFTKAQLGACALTCRYWAGRCRKRIFGSLTLNSEDDLSKLIDFMAIPRSTLEVADLITRLVVEQSDGCVPWAHNVPKLLAEILPNLSHFGYANSPFADANAITTHPNMARIFPAYMSSSGWRITVLELSNQRYTSFSDTVRVVGSLLQLHTLRCTAISWKQPPPDTPNGTRWRVGPYLLSIEVREGGVHWPFLWLMTSTRKDAHEGMRTTSDVAPVFNGLESTLINSIVRVWLNGPGLGSAVTETDFSCRHSRTPGNNEGFLMVEAQLSTGAGPYLSFDFSAQKNAPRKSSKPYSASVNEVSFYDLDKEMTPADVLSFEWRDIDALLSTFPRLRAVTFSFDNPSSWSAGRLYRTCQSIVAAMPETRASGRLSFKYGSQTLHHDDPKAAWLGDDEDDTDSEMGSEDADASSEHQPTVPPVPTQLTTNTQGQESDKPPPVPLKPLDWYNQEYLSGVTSIGGTAEAEVDPPWLACQNCWENGYSCVSTTDESCCLHCKNMKTMKDGLEKHVQERARLAELAFQHIAAVEDQHT